MIVDPECAAETLLRTLFAKGWPVSRAALTPIPDGAGPQTWRVDLARSDGGEACLVLRTDAATPLAGAGSRATEYAALRSAWQAGLDVPRPYLLERDPHVLGAPFFLMSYVEGTAQPKAWLAGDGDALARLCACRLSAIHRAPIEAKVDAPRRALDWIEAKLRHLDHARPALEYAALWCRTHRPAPDETVFAHRDFRVGNLMLVGTEIGATLDWEYAAPSERAEDLGWFCAPAWRHGRLDREAGGLTARETFLAAYEEAGAVEVDRARVYWWSVAGQLRWALIAIAQAARATSGQPDLDLALTGHRLPSVERDLLDMIAPTGSRRGSVAARAFTVDRPDAATLRWVARQVPETPRDADLRDAVHRIADRLQRSPARDVAEAARLRESIRAADRNALSDAALWSLLRSEAAARAFVSRREPEAPVAIPA